MPKFEDIIILVATAGMVVAAGVFFTTRKAAASSSSTTPGNSWLTGSNGANAAPAAWASLPTYVQQDPRSDYSIFKPATDIAGNPIDIAHANTEGGFQ
jgi:hypothetical protein